MLACISRVSPLANTVQEATRGPRNGLWWSWGYLGSSFHPRPLQCLPWPFTMKILFWLFGTVSARALARPRSERARALIQDFFNIQGLSTGKTLYRESLQDRFIRYRGRFPYRFTQAFLPFHPAGPPVFLPFHPGAPTVSPSRIGQFSYRFTQPPTVSPRAYSRKIVFTILWIYGQPRGLEMGG